MLWPTRSFDLFDEMFNDPFFKTGYSDRMSQVMKTDVHETDDEYAMDIELPGYKKEDVKVELSDGYLTINAQHNENKDEKDDKGQYIRKERYSGTCKRSFYVGDTVKQQDINGAFEDGVLKLTVKKVAPQVEEKSPKMIEIK